MDFLKDMWAYFRTRKRYWLAPLLLALLLFGLLLYFAAANVAISPFIYTLF